MYQVPSGSVKLLQSGYSFHITGTRLRRNRLRGAVLVISGEQGLPGTKGQKVSESEFYDHTPGNDKYLVNYHVVLRGETTPPSDLRATEDRAFEANIKENHPDYSFYTSEHNDGHEDRFCRNGEYNPDEVRPPTGREIWRKWQFVFTGNDRAPFWIVRVPKEIIWGHGGLWSDNSVAMLGALFRIQFRLTAGGMTAPPAPRLAPRAPDVQQLNQEKLLR